MGLITPDAFFQAFRNKKATFECLKAFRRFNPTSHVYLVSDGGEDLSDVARFYSCEYERLDRIGPCPWTVMQRMEWLRRFSHAARRGKSSHIMLLEDDVLVRGEIRRSEDFATAGPHHAYARLSGPLFDHLRRRHPHLTSDHYGGCGGSMVHRETLLECARRIDHGDPALSGALDWRIAHSDLFLTVAFLIQGHQYHSLEDVYCEATFAYPGWETNGRPIVHQFKKHYGQQITREDEELLAGPAAMPPRKHAQVDGPAPRDEAPGAPDDDSPPARLRPGSARFRVLIYRGTGNLGDAVQTYAMTRLLPAPLRGVYRDQAAATAGGGNHPAPFVVNGWLGNPTPADPNCLFAGVFIGGLDSEQLAWIRQSRFPVGARDPHTHARLERAGIASEMIGCATLTLPRYDGPRRGTICIDADGPADVDRMSNNVGDIPWPAQWEMAVELLGRLRRAALVVTSRLHVALPCLAMGTPVVIPADCRRRAWQSERLTLLDHLGFRYGRPNLIDVAPAAERFKSFLAGALGTELQTSCEPAPPDGPGPVATMAASPASPGNSGGHFCPS